MSIYLQKTGSRVLRHGYLKSISSSLAIVDIPRGIIGELWLECWLQLFSKIRGCLAMLKFGEISVRWPELTKCRRTITCEMLDSHAAALGGVQGPIFSSPDCPPLYKQELVPEHTFPIARSLHTRSPTHNLPHRKHDHLQGKSECSKAPAIAKEGHTDLLIDHKLRRTSSPAMS